MKCPKCNGDEFYANIKGMQYYNEFGEPQGYIITHSYETKSVRCLHCGYKTTLKKLEERKENDTSSN